MQKNKITTFLIISLTSLVVSIFILYYIFENNNDLQEKIIVYGFIWSIFSFSFSIFFYGILNTIAEVSGERFNINFSIKGAGAFLVILLFGGLYFILKANNNIGSNPKNNANDTVINSTVVNYDSFPIQQLPVKRIEDEIINKVNEDKNKVIPQEKNDSITSLISGRIYLSDNSPLSGVYIVSGEDSTKTNKLGLFKLQIKHRKNVYNIPIKCFTNEGKEIKLENNMIGVKEPTKDFKVIE